MPLRHRPQDRPAAAVRASCSLGDVLVGAAHARRPAVGVDLDRALAVHEPEALLVAGEDPVAKGERLAGGHGVEQEHLDERAVDRVLDGEADLDCTGSSDPASWP